MGVPLAGLPALAGRASRLLCTRRTPCSSGVPDVQRGRRRRRLTEPRRYDHSLRTRPYSSRTFVPHRPGTPTSGACRPGARTPHIEAASRRASLVAMLRPVSVPYVIESAHDDDDVFVIDPSIWSSEADPRIASTAPSASTSALIAVASSSVTATVLCPAVDPLLCAPARFAPSAEPPARLLLRRLCRRPREPPASPGPHALTRLV